MSDVLLTATAGGVRTFTMNRPAARNALSAELMSVLCAELAQADDDPSVGAVVLTGADPAFSAGVDLKEAQSGIFDAELVLDPDRAPWWRLHGMRTPVIAAVNGPAITGGLEMALQCSFIIASERAVFGDSHARVGLHPGGGLTGMLPQAVGVRWARQMSFTGRFVDAALALRIGLVNEVVPHEELLPTAQSIAADIVACDTVTVLALNRTYRDVAEQALGDGFDVERERFRSWRFDAGDIDKRRQTIMNAGRDQIG